MDTLKGHTSMETAYVVDDYPYGFRLRCKIRYWLEHKSGKGFRFCSQTTNPKVTDREVWNKPKRSTYAKLGGVMLRNPDNGHLTWNGLNYGDSTEKCSKFVEDYGYTMPPISVIALEKWIRTREAYEERQAYAETAASGG